MPLKIDIPTGIHCRCELVKLPYKLFLSMISASYELEGVLQLHHSLHAGMIDKACSSYRTMYMYIS